MAGAIAPLFLRGDRGPVSSDLGRHSSTPIIAPVVRARRRPHRIEYTPEAALHLEGLTARQSATVLDTVSRQLTYEPTVATKNRKLLRANSVAPWELRIGDIRVYFDVIDQTETVVVVRAVGIKRRERVFIGGKEVDLE